MNACVLYGWPHGYCIGSLVYGISIQLGWYGCFRYGNRMVMWDTNRAMMTTFALGRLYSHLSLCQCNQPLSPSHQLITHTTTLPLLANMIIQPSYIQYFSFTVHHLWSARNHGMWIKPIFFFIDRWRLTNSAGITSLVTKMTNLPREFMIVCAR